MQKIGESSLLQETDVIVGHILDSHAEGFVFILQFLLEKTINLPRVNSNRSLASCSVEPKIHPAGSDRSDICWSFTSFWLKFYNGQIYKNIPKQSIHLTKK